MLRFPKQFQTVTTVVLGKDHTWLPYSWASTLAKIAATSFGISKWQQDLSTAIPATSYTFRYIACFDLMLTMHLPLIISVNWDNHEMKLIWLHLPVLQIIFIVTVHVHKVAQQDVCPPWFIPNNSSNSKHYSFTEVECGVDFLVLIWLLHDLQLKLQNMNLVHTL